jgi:transposase
VPAVSCGIDWADDHHDVAFVDEHGAVLAAERVEHSAAGLARILELLAAHDPAEGPLEVAIETSKGLLVAGLRAGSDFRQEYCAVAGRDCCSIASHSPISHIDQVSQ